MKKKIEAKAKRITPKQLRFAKKYVETGNASEAYRQAYNTAGYPQTIRPEASKLLNGNHNVSTMVKELQDKLIITTETQVMKLEKIHDLAVGDKQYASAINAVNSQSKHVGLINDKAVVNVNIGRAENTLLDVTPEQMEAALSMLEE